MSESPTTYDDLPSDTQRITESFIGIPLYYTQVTELRKSYTESKYKRMLRMLENDQTPIYWKYMIPCKQFLETYRQNKALFEAGFEQAIGVFRYEDWAQLRVMRAAMDGGIFIREKESALNRMVTSIERAQIQTIDQLRNRTQSFQDCSSQSFDECLTNFFRTATTQQVKEVIAHFPPISAPPLRRQQPAYRPLQ